MQSRPRLHLIGPASLWAAALWLLLAGAGWSVPAYAGSVAPSDRGVRESSRDRRQMAPPADTPHAGRAVTRHSAGARAPLASCDLGRSRLVVPGANLSNVVSRVAPLPARATRCRTFAEHGNPPPAR